MKQGRIDMEMGTTGPAAGGPDETLRNGSKPSGNGGLKAPGNSQAATEKTTSDGGSNLESLRQGSKPKPEAVKEVVYDQSAIAKSRAMYNDHTHDANLASEVAGK
jgi:hypothetical protein